MRAEAKLKVGLSSAGTLVRLSGALTDTHQNGLPQRPLDIRFTPLATSAGSNAASTPDSPERARVFTERDGVFHHDRELPPGRWRVEVSSTESAYLTAADFKRDIEVERAPADLAISLPALVLAQAQQADGAALEVPIRLQATVGGVGISETVEISVDEQPAGRAALDTFGRGTYSLPLNTLSPGEHQVRAELVGAPYVDSAPTTKTLRVSEQITVDARMHEVVERLRRGFGVSGEISDQRGPLAGASISVQLVGDQTPDAPDQPAQQELHQLAQSDEEGKFSAFFPTAELPDGAWSAEVQVLPQVGPAVSEALEPISLDRRTTRWVLNILGALGFLGGLGLLIQRFWRVIQLYFKERRLKKESSEQLKSAMREVETIAPARMASAPELRADAPPSAYDLSGVLWDEWQDRALKNASIQLLDAAGADAFSTTLEHIARAQDSPPAGYFQTPALPAGAYRLEIKAPGFMPAQLELKLPHDGRFQKMRVDMTAIPLKIRRLYQTLIRALDGADRWGALSPREIEALLLEALGEEDAPAGSQARREFVSALKTRLRRGALDPADAPDPAAAGGEQLLALMTAVVEETYFSGRTFDMSVWRFARQLAERLEASQRAHEKNS